jgi:hypothetical protein
MTARNKHAVVAPVVVMTLAVAMIAGVSWGAAPDSSGGQQPRKKPKVTTTVTTTVTATAWATAWATATATVPGPTSTVSVPGPTKTVTATATIPGPTSTVTVPGPTTTVTAPGPASTVTATTPGAPTSTAPTATTTPTTTPSTTPTTSQTPTNPGSVCTPANAWNNGTETYNWTNNGSGAMGEYYVSADRWNDIDLTQQSVFCSRTPDGNSPYFFAQASTAADADGSVKSFPNAHVDFHHWGDNTEPSIDDVDRNPATPNVLTTTFAHQGPSTCTGCSYDWAQEMWLNDYAVEVMIWTDYKTQHPGFVSDYVETVNVDGRSWDVYRAVWGGTGTSRDGYIVFLPANGQSITSGTFNNIAFLTYLKGKGWLGTAPTLSAVGYGVEICQTGGQSKRFDVTNFSVSPLPHLVY